MKTNKTVYDYIKAPDGNAYDAWSVWKPGHSERVICGTPQYLLSFGWIIFGTCRERMMQYAVPLDANGKKYAMNLKSLVAKRVQ